MINICVIFGLKLKCILLCLGELYKLVCNVNNLNLIKIVVDKLVYVLYCFVI